MKFKNKKNLVGLLMITIFIFSCSLFNSDDDNNEEIQLVGPYQADLDNYSYVTYLFCEMFDNGDDGVLIMPTGSSPDSLSVDDVNLQINGDDVEIGQFFHFVAAVYQFNEGEFYNFTLNIKGEISSATLLRPYSVDVVFPDTLAIGEQYSIEWTIENNNLNQGFITDTNLTYYDSGLKLYSQYDEVIYYELDPSAREFEYNEDWLDSLNVEQGSISLAVSQWDCVHDNDIYFVSEEYDEEFYLISGSKTEITKKFSIQKITERISRILN